MYYATVHNIFNNIVNNISVINISINNNYTKKKAFYNLMNNIKFAIG